MSKTKRKSSKNASTKILWGNTCMINASYGAKG